KGVSYSTLRGLAIEKLDAFNYYMYRLDPFTLFEHLYSNIFQSFRTPIDADVGSFGLYRVLHRITRLGEHSGRYSDSKGWLTGWPMFRG
ncbi:MAG: hypothetical protein N0C84_06035, partial [Candidatus Thiodiazotropha taylori]|nr:hypothetical protein [Candidatus Thiodiazotropha taylori]MCW4256014.1 hypothetical protein [Candidatus Thiodiazotropha taylori]